MTRNLKKVHRDAAVDPATVSSGATLRVGSAGRTRGQSRNGAVTKVIVQREVMRTALRLAGGDASRLQIVDATEVVVHNKGRGEVS